jgi:hypothetical protein
MSHVACRPVTNEPFDETKTSEKWVNSVNARAIPSYEKAQKPGISHVQIAVS